MQQQQKADFVASDESQTSQPKSLQHEVDFNTLQACDYAVAGHHGTLCNDVGEFFKPCTQAELDFYQSAQDTELQDIMPDFMGWVQKVDPNISQQIQGIITDDGVVNNQEEIAAALSQEKPDPGAAGTADGKRTKSPAETTPFEPSSKRIKSDMLLMLKDVTAGFKRPNILDVKLGKVLCGAYAKEDKQKRMADIAKATTHYEYGFRIAGMRVFHGALSKDEDNSVHDERQANDPKKYIYYNSDSGYKIYERDYGKHLSVETVRDGFRDFMFNENAGVTEELGKAVCSAFVRELENVLDILTRIPVRMFSSSLLFVFEGDGDALQTAIEKNNEAIELIAEAEEGNASKPRYPAALRTDSGIVLEDEEYLDEDASSELGMRMAELPPMYSVKLIDFAHASLIKEPDENTLLGVRKITDIFTELAEDGLTK